MSIPYYPYAFGYTPNETRLRETVAVATQTFRRSTVTRRLAKIVASIIATLRGNTSAADAWAARHARDVGALNRMAHELETSQPALAAELMLLACR